MSYQCLFRDVLVYSIGVYSCLGVGRELKDYERNVLNIRNIRRASIKRCDAKIYILVIIIGWRLVFNNWANAKERPFKNRRCVGPGKLT